MFRFNLTTVASLAAIAIGVVAATDLALSRTEPTAASTVAARFPAQSELLALPDQGLAPSAACVREHWPYIADECLTSTGGGAVKPPSRTIPIERQIAGDATPLLRVSEIVIR